MSRTSSHAYARTYVRVYVHTFVRPFTRALVERRTSASRFLSAAGAYTRRSTAHVRTSRFCRAELFSPGGGLVPPVSFRMCVTMEKKKEVVVAP